MTHRSFFVPPLASAFLLVCGGSARSSSPDEVQSATEAPTPEQPTTTEPATPEAVRPPESTGACSTCPVGTTCKNERCAYPTIGDWQITSFLGDPPTTPCDYERRATAKRAGEPDQTGKLVVTCVAGTNTPSPPSFIVDGSPKPTGKGVAPELPLESGGLFIENDAFNIFYPRTDRNYTGGGALIFGGELTKLASVPLDLLDAAVLFAATDELKGMGTLAERHQLAVGISVFSPDGNRLDESAPIPFDRPYASLSYIQLSHTRYSDRYHLIRALPTGFALTSELTLGFLGLDYAHQLQAGIHHTLRETEKGQACKPAATVDGHPATVRPFEPCGWRNQISDGGELTGLYSLKAEQLAFETLLPSEALFDVALTSSADVGYYVDGTLGAKLRLGWAKGPFWQTVTTPLGDVNEALEKHPWEYGVDRWWEAYLWAGARTRFVAYNALLEGQFLGASDPVHVTPVPAVLELESGVTVTACFLSLTGVLAAVRTSDFVGDPEALHGWIGAYLTVHGE